MIIFSLLIVFGTFWVIFMTPILYIKSISVQGLTTIPTQEVEEEVQAYLDQNAFVFSQKNHRLFFKKSKLHDQLQSFYNFTSLDLFIKNGVLSIEVEERITSVVWTSNDNRFFVDLDGRVTRILTTQETNLIHERLGLAQIPTEEGEGTQTVLHPTLPILLDVSGNEIREGETILSAEIIEHILLFDEDIRKQILQPTQYELESQDAQWARVRTENGFDLLFDLTLNPREQAETLQSVLAEYTNRLSELSYIDLRFGNHVYVK